ncbi:MAG: hypothetical protein M3Y42_04620 [Actinomycetota bacterium]|nr:hypothetical protein [Actinomycetota bacterium]
MSNLLSGFNRLATAPPWYLRLLFVPLFALFALFALVAFGVAGKRGWVVGAIAAVVYGGLGLAMALAPGGVVAWSRRHPRMDGSVFGPLLFLALAYLTSIAIWICAAVGVVGIGFGVLMGMRRERRIEVGGERS